MTLFYLYHITNGVFINSIRKNGLGGVDPVKDNNLIDVLEELFLICEEKFPEHPTVSSHRVITKLMINQRNGVVQNPFTGESQQHNFTHGELYLHANEYRAVLFAKYQRHGSEILNRVIVYLSVLESQGVVFDYSKYCVGLDLYQIMRNKPNVYVIKFRFFEGLKLESEDRFDKAATDIILNNNVEFAKKNKRAKF